MTTTTYDEEVEFLRQSLVDDPCECGRGPEGHEIRSDDRGRRHPRVYCMTSPTAEANR